MGESGLKAKGDNENTKATGGKLSICPSNRGVTALEAAGPQKRFIGKEAKECTTSFIYQKLLSYMAQQMAGVFNLLIVPASSNGGQASSCSRPVEGTETTQTEPQSPPRSRARQGDTTKRLFIICCTSTPTKQKSSICAHLICHTREH